MGSSLADSWQRGQHALIFTTTSERGDPVSFVPFNFDSSMMLQSFAGRYYGIPAADVSVVEAAVASARFPLVLPPYVAKTSKGKFNFVDGGYADNSGLNVASRVYRHLQSVKVDLGNGRSVVADIHLIVLTTDDGRGTGEQALGTSMFADFAVPLQTLLGVRSRNGPREVADILDSVQDKSKVMKFDFGSERSFLGWALSRRTAKVIEHALTEEKVRGRAGDQRSNCASWHALKSIMKSRSEQTDCSRK